jgi:cell division transport system ATP-binding protein
MARAMIHDPELIIADEPTGNLDWENTQKIADILMKFNQEGKTVLLFTHDIHLLNYIKHSWKINLFKL